MTNAGYFESTQRVSVTDSPNGFTVDGPVDSRRAFYICADVTVHVQRNGDATTDAMRIPANVPVRIHTFGNDDVSFVKGDGADDGSVWVTLTD